MKKIHIGLYMLVLIVLMTGAGQAAVLHTSARVEIVPGVDIQRVGSIDTSAIDEIGGDDAIGFLIDGPIERAVRVAWTDLSVDDGSDLTTRNGRRHDESGALRLEYDGNAIPGTGDMTDSLLLTLEYE